MEGTSSTRIEVETAHVHWSLAFHLDHIPARCRFRGRRGRPQSKSHRCSALIPFAKCKRGRPQKRGRPYQAGLWATPGRNVLCSVHHERAASGCQANRMRPVAKVASAQKKATSLPSSLTKCPQRCKVAHRTRPSRSTMMGDLGGHGRLFTKSPHFYFNGKARAFVGLHLATHLNLDPVWTLIATT